MDKIIVAIGTDFHKYDTENIAFPFHGGFDDKERMNTLARYLAQSLRNYGLPATTINQDETLSAYEQGLSAAKNNAVIYLILKTAFAEALPNGRYPQNVFGVSVYYSVADSELNQKIAVELGEAISTTMNSKFRGAFLRTLEGDTSRDYFGQLRGAAEGLIDEKGNKKSCLHSFIIEHGFRTNIKEAGFLCSEGNLRTLAEHEARAVYNCLIDNGLYI